MKKAAAFILALIIALSVCTVAFADEVKWTCPYCGNVFINLSDREKEEHKSYCHRNPGSNPEGKALVCPYCSREFTDESQYNAHIETCYEQKNDTLVLGGLSISGILDKLVELVDIDAAQWNGVEDIVIRFMDIAENIMVRILAIFAARAA